MSRHHPARTFVLYTTIFQFGLAFIATSAMLRLSRLGLSLAEIAIVNAAFFIGGTLAELPTGLLADGRSRAWSVRVGLLFFAVGCFGYSFITGFWSAVSCEIIAAVGSAFMSGADQAWLADALALRQEKDALGRTLGTAAAWNAAAVLTGGVLGGLLATHGLNLPWLVAGASSLVSFAVCLVRMNNEGEPIRRVSEGEALRRSYRLLRGRRALLWTAAANATFALVTPFNLYWTLRYEPRVGQIGLSWVWVVIYGSLLVAGWTTRSKRIWNGRETVAVTAALACCGLGLAGAGIMSNLGLALTCAGIHEFGRGAFNPILSALTQKHVESECRATYGSLQSLIGKVGFSVAILFVVLALGKAAPEAHVINLVWLASGVLLVLAAIVLWVARPKTQT